MDKPQSIIVGSSKKKSNAFWIVLAVIAVLGLGLVLGIPMYEKKLARHFMADVAVLNTWGKGTVESVEVSLWRRSVTYNNIRMDYSEGTFGASVDQKAIRATSSKTVVSGMDWASLLGRPSEYARFESYVMLDTVYFYDNNLAGKVGEMGLYNGRYNDKAMRELMTDYPERMRTDPAAGLSEMFKSLQDTRAEKLVLRDITIGTFLNGLKVAYVEVNDLSLAGHGQALARDIEARVMGKKVFGLETLECAKLVLPDFAALIDEKTLARLKNLKNEMEFYEIVQFEQRAFVARNILVDLGPAGYPDALLSIEEVGQDIVFRPEFTFASYTKGLKLTPAFLRMTEVLAPLAEVHNKPLILSGNAAFAFKVTEDPIPLKAEVSFAAAELGSLSLIVDMVGSVQAINDEKDQALLNSAELQITDSGFMQIIYTLLGLESGLSPAEMRAEAIETISESPENSAAEHEFKAALLTFLEKGGQLVVKANPPQPLPIGNFLDELDFEYDSAGISITATPPQ